MKKTNIHNKRVKYLVDNNLTVSEASKILNISTSTIYRNLKFADKNIVDKYYLIKSVNKKKIKKKKPIYILRAENIINDNTISTLTEASKKLNISKNALNSSMLLLKYNDYLLYKKVKETLKSRRYYEIEAKKVIEYILSNKNCSKQDIISKYKYNEKVYRYIIKYISIHYHDKYKCIKNILRKNKNTLCNKYMNYIIDNNCSFQDAANHFNVSLKCIQSSYYNVLKYSNVELYNSIKIMRILNKNIK